MEQQSCTLKKLKAKPEAKQARVRYKFWFPTEDYNFGLVTEASAIIWVQSALATFTPVTQPKPDLAKLWKQYEAFKKPLVSQTTYAVDYRKYRNHIAKLPTQNIEEAIAIRDYLVANLSPNTTKRVLTNLSSES